jgi:hypothetical protein
MKYSDPVYFETLHDYSAVFIALIEIVLDENMKKNHASLYSIAEAVLRMYHLRKSLQTLKNNKIDMYANVDVAKKKFDTFKNASLKEVNFSMETAKWVSGYFENTLFNKKKYAEEFSNWVYMKRVKSAQQKYELYLNVDKYYIHKMNRAINIERPINNTTSVPSNHCMRYVIGIRKPLFPVPLHSTETTECRMRTFNIIENQLKFFMDQVYEEIPDDLPYDESDQYDDKNNTAIKQDIDSTTVNQYSANNTADNTADNNANKQSE